MFFDRLRTISKTLRFQLMVWNAIAVFVVTLGTLLLMRVGVHYTLVREFDQMLENDLREIAEICKSFTVDGRDRSFLQRNLDRKAKVHAQSGWFCELLEPRTKPGKNSGQFEKPRVVYMSSGVVPEELADFFFPDSQPAPLANYRVFAGTSRTRNNMAVRIRLGATVTSLEHSVEVLDKILILGSLVSLFVAPLGAYWLVVRATRPLAKIISVTERSRPTHLDERLPIRDTGDELDQLSYAMNSMMDRIADYIAKNQRLLANSAHELRTPLAALRTTAEVALASERSSDEYQRTILSIIDECKNLELLVNQLLLLAETENVAPPSLPAVNFGELVSNACSMFEAVAEIRETQLEVRVDEGAYIHGNRMHLRQLINNLIDNALKFTPSGGRVSVALSTDKASQQCRLQVADSGIGISPAEMERLFERFYRGDPTRRHAAPTRGTGLGLSVCKAVVESHGGTMEVNSEPSEGTCFTVILPLSANPPVDSQPSESIAATCT